MSKFTEIARKTTTFSEVMNNREKIDTQELIAKHPDGVTIMECDMVTVLDGSYAIVAFKEEPTRFYNCGAILTNIVGDWIREFDGDIEECSSQLKLSGGVRVRLEEAKTADGKRSITRVTVLD